MKKHSINMFQIPPLMVFEYEGDINKLFEHVCNIEYTQNNDNIKSNDDYVLDDDNLKELKQFCSDSVKEYVKDVVGIEHEMGIQQSWVNVNKPNQSHSEHYHPNSYISGVFYLSSDQNGGAPIIFTSDLIKSNFSVRLMSDQKEDVNKYYPSVANSYVYPSVPGQLILFSSNTPHFVPKNTSKSDRVSLSFNTFPKLPLGSKHGLTYLRG